MTYLVGDIGGTNTRLAFAEASGLLPQTVMRAQNDDYANFGEVLSEYLASHSPNTPLLGTCIAIAGPVQDGRGRLTNRDWALEADMIAAQSGAQRGDLINDLSALGYALARVTPEHLCGGSQEITNGQALVVGLGTGFNVSPIKFLPNNDVVVVEAELGHSELPTSISRLLSDALGPLATPFQTVEDIFCGPGLERLHAALSGQTLSGQQIMAAFNKGDANADKTVRLFAYALGLLTRSVVHQYLPRNGLAFAGSVSRSVLSSAALSDFKTALALDGNGIVDASQFPVSVITEDAAALEGCLQHLKQARPVA